MSVEGLIIRQPSLHRSEISFHLTRLNITWEMRLYWHQDSDHSTTRPQLLKRFCLTKWKHRWDVRACWHMNSRQSSLNWSTDFVHDYNWTIQHRQQASALAECNYTSVVNYWMANTALLSHNEIWPKTLRCFRFNHLLGSESMELSPAVCSWPITDTDSVLFAL